MYNIYKDELVQCPFCKKTSNLYYVNQHLKSKSCKKFQDNYIKVNKKRTYNLIMLEHQQSINDIKANLKLEID